MRDDSPLESGCRGVAGTIGPMNLWIVFSVLGVAITVFGWRGRRVGTHDVCRACGFDLTGLRESGVVWRDLVCPGCGRNLGRSAALGDFHRLPRVMLLGVLVALLGGGGFMAQQKAQARGKSLWQYAPDWAIIHFSGSRGSEAEKEYGYRLVTNTLGDRAWRAILKEAKLQLDGPSAYDADLNPVDKSSMPFGRPPHGIMFVRGLKHGRATNEDWEWYASRCTVMRLIADQKFDAQEIIQAYVVTGPEFGFNTNSVQYERVFSNFLLLADGIRIEPLGISFTEGGNLFGSIRFQLPDAVVVPSTGVLEVELVYRVRHNNPKYPPVEITRHIQRDVWIE